MKPFPKISNIIPIAPHIDQSKVAASAPTKEGLNGSPVSTDLGVPRKRVLSVDVLRGFDMFWIIGGERVAKALGGMSDGPVVSLITTQLGHVPWEGLHFYDIIFPLFLFLVGISIVLSMDRVLQTGGRRAALVRIARRSAMLFVIGVLYYGGVEKEWPEVALSGVLPRIALCYFCAASLYVWLSRKGIVIAAMICLVGYAALMMFVPFPNINLGAVKGPQASALPKAVLLADATTTVNGVFEQGRNLANYVDFRWLPGKKGNIYYTNEGLLSTIPAVATTLFGIMAGWLLTSTRHNDLQKVAWLFAAGAGGVLLGCLWGIQFPIIKKIWTSSYCLVTAGCAAMLMSVFYLIVDVWRWQRWSVPFLWIGTNALTIYLLMNVVNFELLAARFLGGDVKKFLNVSIAKGAGGLVIAVGGLLLPILFARFLYQRRIFIRL